MGTYTRGAPTPEIVRALTPGSGATGTLTGVHLVKIPVAASATGTVLSWLNPEGAAVAARLYYRYTTAGTGTVDAGLSAAGTGSDDTIINGGAMAAGQLIGPGTVSATAVTGNTQTWFVVGSGSGIVFNHNEAATGTAVGAAYIEYFLL